MNTHSVAGLPLYSVATIASLAQARSGVGWGGVETRCNVLIFRRCPQTFVEPAEVAGLASERAVPEFDIVFQGLSVLEAFVDTSDASDLHVVFGQFTG